MAANFYGRRRTTEHELDRCSPSRLCGGRAITASSSTLVRRPQSRKCRRALAIGVSRRVGGGRRHLRLGLSRVEAAPDVWVCIYDPPRTVIDLMRLRAILNRSRTQRSIDTCAVATLDRQSYSRRQLDSTFLGRFAEPRCRDGAMSRPTRRTPAGRAYLDLQNRARAEGRGTQELLTLYVVERWLARLSVSPYTDQFVLEGGTSRRVRRPSANGGRRCVGRELRERRGHHAGRSSARATSPCRAGRRL